MSTSAPQVAAKSPQEAQGEPWMHDGDEANQEAQEGHGEARGGHENAVGIPVGHRPGRNGGTIALPWTSESRPHGGRPKGSISLVAELTRQLRERPEEREAIVAAWINSAKSSKNKRQMAAVLSILDRVDGPVVKQVAKVEHKVAQSSYEVTVRQGGPVHRGELESAQGPTVDAVQQSGVAQGGAPALLAAPGSPVTSQVPGGASGARLEPHAPPASSGALEARLGALEGQVSQLVQLMTQVLQQKREGK